MRVPVGVGMGTDVDTGTGGGLGVEDGNTTTGEHVPNAG